MARLAIQARGLAKRYRLGTRAPYHTLREALMRAAAAPLGLISRRWANANPTEAPTVWALDDVSFDVEEGEVVGVIGRNGAGKSTLAKLLSRITDPTRGEVELRGRVGALLEVGTGFHPELTGRENIYLSGAVLGMRRIEIAQRFDAIVDFAEVERFLDTQVKHYSTGMFTRLAFAVAAHLDPEILIVDEVLAVGDAAFQRKCLNKMEDVGRAGRTVLFVSHNMPAITRLCPRSLLLDQGRLVRDGPSHEVVNAYLSSGIGTSSVREWPDVGSAPGNDFVRLRAVRLRDDTGAVVGTFDIQEPIHVEVEYQNLPNDRHPYANIQLFDENGTCLFASGDFTNQEWRHQARQFAGTVRSVCIIPGNFLAEGRLTVLVALTTHNPTELLALERDAVAFMVVDHSQGDGARGEYVGSFPGVVRPLLDWRVTLESPRTLLGNE